MTDWLVLAVTAGAECVEVGLPFRAHLSAVTWPAAIAALGYWWRDGVVAFLKDVHRDLP